MSFHDLPGRLAQLTSALQGREVFEDELSAFDRIRDRPRVDLTIGIATFDDFDGCQWPLVSARPRPVDVPAGGQQDCPVMANGSAH